MTKYPPTPEMNEAMLQPEPLEREANIEHVAGFYKLTYGTGLAFDEEFHNLYKYYKDTVFSKFAVIGPFLFMVFQIGKSAGDIKTLTAQGMMGGYIVAGLPVALGLILFAMNQEYLGRMVFAGETQPCGWIMLGSGVFMIIIGFIAIMKIVKIEV